MRTESGSVFMDGRVKPDQDGGGGYATQPPKCRTAGCGVRIRPFF